MATKLVCAPLAISDPQWARLVDAHPAGWTPFHDPVLVGAVSRVVGREAVGLGAWRGEELVGGVFVVVPQQGQPTPVSPLAYNGPLIASSQASTPERRTAFSAAVAEVLFDGLRDRFQRCEIRMVPLSADVRGVLTRGWCIRPTFTYHVDISDLGVAWQRMERDRRRLVKRAEQMGYCIERSIPAQLSSVDRSQLAAVLERLNDDQQARVGGAVEVTGSGWRQVVEVAMNPDRAALHVAYDRHGVAVAFQCASIVGADASMLFTGVDSQHIASGVNGLLRWEAMADLHKAGVQRFDLNGARPGEVGRFKASFGGELTERWDLIGSSPEARRSVAWRLARRLRGLGRSVSNRGRRG